MSHLERLLGVVPAFNLKTVASPGCFLSSGTAEGYAKAGLKVWGL